MGKDCMRRGGRIGASGIGTSSASLSFCMRMRSSVAIDRPLKLVCMGDRGLLAGLGVSGSSLEIPTASGDLVPSNAARACTAPKSASESVDSRLCRCIFDALLEARLAYMLSLA